MGVRRTFDLIYYKTTSDLQSEIHRSYAGMVWWILDPLLSLAVYYAVFGFMFRHKEPHYTLFLFVGIVIWRWYQNCMQHASNSLIAHRPLMLLVNVHKIVFPVSAVFADGFKFLLSLGVCLILAGFTCDSFGWVWLSLPLVILMQLSVVVGCCLVVAAVTPFVPDIYFLLPTALQLMMFLSGVFYRVDTMPKGVQPIIRMNPMTCVIEEYRAVIVDGRLPSLSQLAILTAFGLVASVVGGFLIHRNDKVYPKLA